MNRGLFLLRILKVYRIDKSIRLIYIRIHSVYVKEGPRQSSHHDSSGRGRDGSNSDRIEECRGERKRILHSRNHGKGLLSSLMGGE